MLFRLKQDRERSFQPVPPMGVNTWKGFGPFISEAAVSNIVFAMNRANAKAYGYTYVNLDDGFFRSRAGDGTLQVDAKDFPHGPHNTLPTSSIRMATGLEPISARA
jgi:alpha-galactosidase